MVFGWLSGALELVHSSQPAVGIEDRRRQGLGEFDRLRLAEPCLRRSGPAEDFQTLPSGDDLPPCAAVRGVGPRALLLRKVEEDRDDLANVAPVTRIIGLDHEQPAGDQRAMHQRQEPRGDQPAIDLRGVVMRLRMIAVNLDNRAGFDMLGEEFAAAADGVLQVRQAPLVAAAAGVANDDGQRVDTEMVVVRPGDGTGEQEPTVAAADVEDDRGLSAEELRPMHAAFGVALEGGLRPFLPRSNGTGEGYAEFVFDLV